MAKVLDLNGLEYFWGKVKAYVSAKAISKEEKGAADGVATLTSSGKLTDTQFPNYIDTILEYQTPRLISPNPNIKLNTAKDAEYIVYIESKNIFCAYYNGEYYGSWGAGDNVADADKYGDAASDNKGRVPKTGILYLNKTDLKNYKYNGSTKLVEIYQGGADIETITTGEIDNIFAEKQSDK